MNEAEDTWVPKVKEEAKLKMWFRKLCLNGNNFPESSVHFPCYHRGTILSNTPHFPTSSKILLLPPWSSIIFTGRAKDPSIACEGLCDLSAFLWLLGAYGNLCIFLRNSMLSHFLSSIFASRQTSVVTVFLKNYDFLVLSYLYEVPVTVSYTFSICD